MDRKRFFDSIRASLFGGALSGSQVAGLETILAEAERRNEELANTAYALATTHHETGATMQPVREGFAKSDAAARAYVRKHYAAKYGKPAGPYGQYYYGRGYVQLTWLVNYERAAKKLGFDFVKRPDMVMDPKWAVRILFDGMSEGWFTGKSFKSYIDNTDESDAEDGHEYEGARRIINGTDKAKQIAVCALKYEAALRAAGYGEPHVAKPNPAPAPQAPASELPDNAPPPNWFVLLLDAILSIFRKRK